jgi:hypothetical protein
VVVHKSRGAVMPENTYIQVHDNIFMMMMLDTPSHTGATGASMCLLLVAQAQRAVIGTPLN